MQRISSLAEAEAKVLADMKEFFQMVRSRTPQEIKSTVQGAKAMRELRSAVYENLNQIQHEYLLVRAMQWLVEEKRVPSSVVWFWNPRQTGDSSEPDLQGKSGNEIVLSGEATTSEKPQGVIDTRMKKTLEKLSTMPGNQYYFVRSEAMASRARTKCAKEGWRIEVHQL